MTTSKTNKQRNILSISQLNRRAKQLLEGSFPSVWVEGEISNLARPSSGHWYFSLKDDNAQVRCAMFRNSNMRLRFQPESGQEVLIRAKLSLYESRGDYQLIAEHMELSGDGALSRAFEALKSKLQAEGLFDEANKQELPELSKHIAVITSPSGAAIHDILTVMARRFPATKITIIPTAVQGKGAAAEIASAIQTANQLAQAYGFDVILTGRGGGSMEDLWAFNEEIVARAIHKSRLPIVSAVGHEVDFTIADFAADARAPTPSAAAELLTPDGQELASSFAGFEQLLFNNMARQLHQKQQELKWQQKRLRHPGHRLSENNQRLDELELRLTSHCRNNIRQQHHNLTLLDLRLQQVTPINTVEQLKQQTSTLSQALAKQLKQTLANKTQQLSKSVQVLNAVSPLATLERGYAIVTDSNKNIVKDIQALKPGQKVSTRLAQGVIHSTVEGLEAIKK